MSILVAVLDADVLVPILSCDLLLSAFDEDLYWPVVTTAILDEVERCLVDGFTHLDPVALRPASASRDQRAGWPIAGRDRRRVRTAAPGRPA